MSLVVAAKIISMNTPMWLVAIAVIVIALYIYGTWTHKHFENMGIPGPKPFPLFGNINILMKEGFFCDKWLTKKYGRVFGLYDGIQPVLIVSDADLIKEITMKHSEHFINHRTDIFNKELDRTLVVLKNDEWKTVRSIISPVFSGGKLKAMMGVMNQCAKECVDQLGVSARNGETSELKDVAGRFTLDVVGKTLFGVQTDSTKTKDNDFVETASKAFDDFTFASLPMLVIVLFPFLAGLLKKLGSGILSSRTLKFFDYRVREILNMRRGMEHKPVDFVQLLLDARAADEQPQMQGTMTEKARYKNKRALTEEEIVANCILFFLAGYDTTSTAIAFIMHLLALHPEVQDRVAEEIKEKWDSEELSFDTVFSMRYLDQVFNETFRLFPPALRTDRLCTKDCQIGPYNIKKGQTINISIIGTHYDEEYWPDASKFDPERFSPENKSNIVPCSFIPFGSGARSCVGKRLAELVTKTAVIYLVKHFQISVCEKTENPVQLRNLPIVVPVNGIWLRMDARN